MHAAGESGNGEDPGSPPLGLRSGTAEVRPYDSRWPAEFTREHAWLDATLAAFVEGIEHIGSTSVPGLPAKPALDIAVASQDPDRLHPLLESLGYGDRNDLGARGGVVYAKGPREARTAYLHVVAAGDIQWRRWLDFRDLLRRDPQLRDEYGRLKQALSAAHTHDRAAYRAGKSRFIHPLLEELGYDVP